ncbi:MULTISPECIES: SDR family oxidoreductase [unclassified Cyanobium]|uniref:SDR family oxidoreductase n=1 Tax=unclassified Cyanobium TaxID=2627006 RepID=UPI0020CDD0AB|nr:MULTISPECIES: SDR family oxidoreductase [unclassified Cyanobium]MCP9835721.1 SDR family oxidoreductase [Cyanobium sp. La Preciosa 7G6]MCP9938521.1 SDR family oxidoreductase [Cyanobium sp. Aljojuca 7A6]
MATYLITGANRGIGLEYCRQLQARGDTVVAVCRTPSPELEALGVRLEAGVDLTEEAAIAALVERLGPLAIDGLILNAGLLERTSLDDLDVDSLRRQFEVNAVAPLRLTQALLGHLPAGAKVILMTSRMGSIEDNSSGGAYGYRMSKVALCMAGKSLAIDLRPRGIAVALLHPGLVRTRMTGFSDQGISTEESVHGLLARMDALTLETSGTFWHANGQELPW